MTIIASLEEQFAESLVASAREFHLTSGQARTIAESDWSSDDLQRAMVAHLWRELEAQCRRDHGWHFLPLHVRTRFGLAWDLRNAEILAIAAAELNAALARKVAA